MRAFATLALSLVSAPAYADAVAERVVAIVQQACVAPSTPEAQMVAAEQMASSGAWKGDPKLSGRQRGVVANPDDLKRPEMYEVRDWNFEEPLFSGRFRIAVVRPEWSGWRQNGCSVYAQAVSVGDVVSAARIQLGLGEPQPSAAFGQVWVVSGDVSKPHEVTRMVSAQRQQLRSGETTIFGVYEFQVPASGAVPAPVETSKSSE
ncbi:hypothetical protein [Bosea sp. LC85]|uniref:hypothetical protein n=1 Tax=Bosea sp. LC85 TaxID=1502851 RepID=UPI00126A2758|nr:hypothetical protein [Bosea sp. LC85]